MVILTIIVQNHEASAYRALIFSGRLQPWHRSKRGRSYPLWIFVVRSARSRRSRLVRFAPKADRRESTRYVCFVPKADIRTATRFLIRSPRRPRSANPAALQVRAPWPASRRKRRGPCRGRLRGGADFGGLSDRCGSQRAQKVCRPQHSPYRARSATSVSNTTRSISNPS